MDLFLKVNDEFKNCESFMSKVSELERATYSKFVKKNTSGHGERENWTFLSITLKCERSGNYKPRGKAPT